MARGSDKTQLEGINDTERTMKGQNLLISPLISPLSTDFKQPARGASICVLVTLQMEVLGLAKVVAPLVPLSYLGPRALSERKAEAETALLTAGSGSQNIELFSFKLREGKLI